MKTLDDFKKNNIPKRRKSKLQKYKKQINDLYDSGYSVKQIQKFLKLNNTAISTSQIWKFLQKEKMVITQKTVTTKTIVAVDDNSDENNHTKNKAMAKFLTKIKGDK